MNSGVIQRFPLGRAQFLRTLGYGVASWFAVFAVSMALYPWRVDNRPLFESVIPVVMAAVNITLMTLYLSRISSGFLAHGALCGALWVAENFICDFFAFSIGPMQLSFAEYVQDIGVTYLMIPVVTVGLAWQRELRHNDKQRRD